MLKEQEAGWKEDYNHVRPHSGLGGATPTEVAAVATQAGPGHTPARLAITTRFGHHNSEKLYPFLEEFPGLRSRRIGLASDESGERVP
ncbi:integrase core domain-containing protein [Azospirillum palustre]|uniref:integrase core domain-containing protein n=1 Tax=Azospirillum palustre TaxID=2044885 RepID=UPI003CC7C5DF